LKCYHIICSKGAAQDSTLSITDEHAKLEEEQHTQYELDKSLLSSISYLQGAMMRYFCTDIIEELCENEAMSCPALLTTPYSALNDEINSLCIQLCMATILAQNE